MQTIGGNNLIETTCSAQEPSLYYYAKSINKNANTNGDNKFI
jgi:hypothetical protein